jgi:inner membrane protein
MPLPLAHTAAGLATYITFGYGETSPPSKVTQTVLILLAVTAANAADLDFAPGIFIGAPNRFHHGPSHSLLAAICIAALLFLASRRYVREVTPYRLFGLLAAAALSHPLLDFFSVDTAAPFGVPLSWPFYNGYQISGLLLFGDVRRASGSISAFFGSLFNDHNLRTACGELLFALALITAAFTVKERRQPLRFWPLLGAALSVTILFYGFQVAYNLSGS